MDFESRAVDITNFSGNIGNNSNDILNLDEMSYQLIGNDGNDIDVVKTYPNDSKDLLTEVSDNVLTIGAMSADYNENLPASLEKVEGVEMYRLLEHGYSIQMVKTNDVSISVDTPSDLKRVQKKFVSA